MTDTNYIAVAMDKDGTTFKDHFGIAPLYAIYNRSGELIEKRENLHGVGQEDEQPHTSSIEITDLLKDCNVFIAITTGHHLAQVQAQGVEVVITESAHPHEAVKAYLG